MKTLRLGLVGFGLLSIWVGMAGGCSATPIDEDDDGSTTTSSTSAATSGSGGSTGTGGSGGTGGDPGPCGQDCGQINTPQCLKSVCNDGSYPGVINTCVVVPDDAGIACDDGLFCTVEDACDGNGACAGGPQNDCGMTAPECNAITCDEQAKSCTNQALADGTTCTSADLCLSNTTCTAGVCGDGTPKDCFFSPVPNECFNSECNPANGMCEPVAGNDGDPCVDQMDLCSAGNTCAAGVCSGGSPKDCSSFTQGCMVGVCDAANGSCFAQAVMNGGLCDDLDACTTGELCTNGTCSGGAAVTTCTGMTSDGCCPSSCTPTNDIDCACGLDKILIIENHIGSDYAVLQNPTTCALDLGGMEVIFDDSTSTDLTFVIPPNTMVQAGGTLLLTESSSPPAGGLYVGGNILFSGTRGGAVILCDGSCSNPANIVDYMAWEGSQPPPALPAGVTFSPSAVTGIASGNESTMSHIRQASNGSAPNFLLADWTIGPKTQP